MIKLTLVILCLSVTPLCYAQTFKIDNGGTVSRLKNKGPDIFPGSVSAYSGLLGVEYLDRSHFYLSSEIGYLSQGGKTAQVSQTGALLHQKEAWSYVHLNTTFRGRVFVSKTELFAGMGLYMNKRLGNEASNTAIFDEFKANNLNWGGRLEAGFSELPGRFKIEIYATYLAPFSATASTPFTSWDSRSWGAYVSIGYRLK